MEIMVPKLDLILLFPLILANAKPDEPARYAPGASTVFAPSEGNW